MLGNGIDVLRETMALEQIMAVVERTARWVAPETYHLLPVWYPEYARGMHLSTGNWSEPRARRETKAPAYETNVQAAKALTTALGLTNEGRRNWSCCHIWGVDDPKFASRNAIVRDHRFYSCVGNMVLLPDPLKAFTDCIPEVKAMLRLCARNLYGRTCDPSDPDGASLDALAEDAAYPSSWPRRSGSGGPQGMMPLTERVATRARQRLAEIRRDLQIAGPRYPRQEVLGALAEFGIDADR